MQGFNTCKSALITAADEVSKRASRIWTRTANLAAHAEFHVNITSVIGGGIKNPEDALVVARRAVELGFSSTVGVIHDGERAFKTFG